MNTVLIMLGSNFQPEKNLPLAIEKLSSCFEVSVQTEPIITQPFGEHYRSDFHNMALKILSSKDAEQTRQIFKQIEREMGRTPESKKEGIIPIDIDLIFWNQTLLHDDYKRFDFVKKCVDDLIK